MYRNTSVGGFTLVEVLIVVVILAVLSAIAVPAYQKYGDRSRRGDAISSLMRLQMAQEKWRADDMDYGTLEEIGLEVDSLSGYYTMAIVDATGASYTASATPKANGPQQGDDCGTFAVNQDGPLFTGYASATCWSR